MALELMDEVCKLNKTELREYIRARAEGIVGETQGDEWDDCEEWTVDAAELAHAVMRWLNMEPR